MSPVNKKVIEDKFIKFQESVKVLNELKDASRVEFLKDTKIQGAAMFNMVISVELIVDIGNHILTEVFQAPARTYKDVIIGLGEKGVIPKDFSKENEKMSDFRNMLIHDYSKITLDQVYDHLQKAPDIFRQFAKYFVEFLEKQK